MDKPKQRYLDTHKLWNNFTNMNKLKRDQILRLIVVFAFPILITLLYLNPLSKRPLNITEIDGIKYAKIPSPNGFQLYFEKVLNIPFTNITTYACFLDKGSKVIYSDATKVYVNSIIHLNNLTEINITHGKEQCFPYQVEKNLLYNWEFEYSLSYQKLIERQEVRFIPNTTSYWKRDTTELLIEITLLFIAWFGLVILFREINRFIIYGLKDAGYDNHDLKPLKVTLDNNQIVDIYQENINSTHRDFKELIDLFNEAHAVMIKIGEKVCAESIKRKSYKSGLITVFFSDAIETMNAAYNLCVQGYYESAAKLLRNVFENSLLIKKLHVYQEKSFSFDKDFMDTYFDKIDSYGSLDELEKQKFDIALLMDINKEADERKISKFMRVFGATKIIQDVVSTDEQDMFKESYHKLSQMSHPSFAGILSRLEIINGLVKFTPAYKAEFAKVVLEDIIKSLHMCSISIRDEFPLEGLGFTEKELKKLNDLQDSYDKLIPPANKI